VQGRPSGHRPGAAGSAGRWDGETLGFPAVEFLREAPIGAIVLVVIGAVMVLFVSSALQVNAARRKAARERQERETGLPSPTVEEDGTRMAFVVNVAGYALMTIGFAIWIFD